MAIEVRLVQLVSVREDFASEGDIAVSVALGAKAVGRDSPSEERPVLFPMEHVPVSHVNETLVAEGVVAREALL